MANTKKSGSKPKSKSGKSTSSKKSTSTKKTNTKNTTKSDTKSSTKSSKKSEVQEPLSFYEENRYLIVLIYFVVTIILASLAIFKGINIWATVRGAMYAFFGSGFIVMILCLAVITVRAALNNLKKGVLSTTFAALGVSAVVSSFVHIALNTVGLGSFDEWLSQLQDAADKGMYISVDGFTLTGGIIGAVFGGGLLQSIALPGSILILSILLVVFMILFLNIKFSSVGKAVASVINSIKSKFDYSAQKIKDKKLEKAENPKPEKEKKEKKQKEKKQKEIKTEEETIEETPQHFYAADFDFNTSDVNIEYTQDEPYESEDSKEDFSNETSDFFENEESCDDVISQSSFEFAADEISNETADVRTEEILDESQLDLHENVFSQKDEKPTSSIFSKETDYSNTNHEFTLSQRKKLSDEEIQARTQRRMKKREPQSSIFTRYTPQTADNLSAAYTVETDDFAQGETPETHSEKYDEVFKKCVDEINGSSDETADKSATELSKEAQKIVKEAALNADENDRKNKAEVEGYVPKKEYSFPPIECLKEPDFSREGDYAYEMKTTAQKLVDTLKSFGVETKLIGVSRGPSVTRYELQPAPGVKISKITNLADDIALNLASSGVRIEAPIPNKSAVGIEVPNQLRATVTLREIISANEFKNSKSKLNVALGKDITGGVTCADLAKMPHLLIAGTTGSGKSVCLNCMIVSILYNAKPTEVKLLMIDPKQVEFSVYNGIPHLLVPVISDVRKAAGSLAWAVTEMENRYKTFSQCGVRDINGFNKYIKTHPDYQYMPQIVIFIDELNDLMMISPKEVEDSICRLAQKARAAGMHLVVATQRPSVDVITGIIKANIPSRISLSVSSQVDSRTILDTIGAEKLLGNGDMLFNPVGVSKPVRIQGAFLSDSEIEKIIDYIKSQANVEYDDEVMDEIERNAVMDKKKNASAAAGESVSDSADDMLVRAMDIGSECEVISVSLLQRKLKIGYSRAARIVDELDEMHLVGPAVGGGKPRKFLMTRAQYLERVASSSNQTQSDETLNDADDFDIFSD